MAMTVSVDLTALGRQFESEITRVVQAIATSVVTELAVRTPIDEGTAKSNWTVGVNALGNSPIPAHDPGKGGSTFQENVNDTIMAAAGPIASATFRDTVNVTNRLDYINKLNNGSSLQAPAGFVEDAVVIAVNSVPNIRIVP